MKIASRTAAAASPDYELDDLERLLAGTFDNYEQVYWEEQQQVHSSLRHRRITSVYRRVDLPAFEGRVFYAHKWWDGNPAAQAYRSLYVVRRDTNLDLLRLELLAIKHPERFDTALEDDALLHVLRPDEVTSMAPECNTIWRREGDGFRVAMAGDCRLTSVSPTGEPLAMTVDTRVDASTFLYLSYGRDAQGAILFGPKDLTPSRELRARWFDGLIRTRGGEHRVRIHDQGGLCTVDGPNGMLRVRLRQVRWPTHERAPVLALIVMQGEQQEVLLDAPADIAPTIVTASTSATSIGLQTADCEIRLENPRLDYREDGR